MSCFKYVIIFLLSVGLFSCSKSDDDIEVEKSEGFAKFSKSEISVSSKGGQSSAIVVWDNVEWEIENSTNNSIISNISPISGGKAGGSDLTTITFTVSENSSIAERSQEIYVVNKETGEKETVIVNQSTLPVATVSANTKHQEVVGFGGMYNPTIWLSSQDMIDSDELATMYDPNGKLQYSILRLMIYPNKSNWDDDIAGALQAQNYGAIIFACPWDCTDALADYVDKDGDGELNDKHLPAENYDAYADHIIEYINYMKTKGVNIYAVSVQNEPDMHFTYWTPEEIATFTADYGAKIRATGVKLMSPEACGFQSNYTNAVINSPEAFANADIIAGHLYQGFTDLSSSYVKNRHDYICDLYPTKLKAAGKSWWMTEKLFGSYGDDLENGSYKTWAYNLEKLGLEMHMCMEGYCSAYVYWYLKRFYGMIGDNNADYAYVPEGEIMKNGYIMGHYSAYATGMTRISIEGLDEDILATAYINDTEDVITVVALNMTDDDYETFIKMPVEITTHKAIETSENYNMKDVETVLSDDSKHLKIKISANSIYSLRIEL